MDNATPKMWLGWYALGFKARLRTPGAPQKGPTWVSCVCSGALTVAEPSALGRGWWGAPLTGPHYLKGAGVRLKGKSFKWRRKAGALALRLGYSHASTVSYPPTLTLGVLRRNYLAVWGTSSAEIRAFGDALRGLREPNIYHGRGLRFSKHRLLRKAGKVSAYR